MYFFGSNQFGKTQKRQVRQALDAGKTDRLMAILSTYEPDANTYGLIEGLEFHTLLTYACFRGQLDIVKMLVETFNVDTDKRDRRELMTPLMYCALYNETNTDIVRYLREECSVDIECVDQNGQTAAQLAQDNENALIARYLSNPIPSAEEKSDEVQPVAQPATEHVEDEDAARQREEAEEEQRIRIASMESALEESNKRCNRLIQENMAADEAYKAIQEHVRNLEAAKLKLENKVAKEDERRQRLKNKWEAALSESQDEVSKLRRKLLMNRDSDRNMIELREHNALSEKKLTAARQEITSLKQELTRRSSERERREEEVAVMLNELRMELAEKDRQMLRAEEERRVREAEAEAQDKKEDGFESDDFVVIEPPEESSRQH